MREIPLTQGKVAMVDDENFEELNQYRWYAHRQGRNIYAARKQWKNGPVRQEMVIMHRVIMRAPAGQDVDHRNGDGLDNQKVNLRFATNSQNQANQKLTARNKSGRRGVSRSGNRWIAIIYKNRKQIALGRFNDLDDAARAYDKAAREIFGEFARPNFGYPEAVMS